MKKTILAQSVARAIEHLSRKRATTNDIAFTFRMGAGFPGDVNRTHPANIIPGLISSAAPPRFYGYPVVIDTSTNSYRAIGTGDTAVTTIDGVVVRPYPTQQTSGGMSATIGVGVPSANQPLDVLSEGYIMVQINTATPSVTKKGRVFIWVTADSSPHVLGGFESVAASSNTIELTNAYFNGPPDANGITEVVIQRVSI